MKLAKRKLLMIICFSFLVFLLPASGLAQNLYLQPEITINKKIDLQEVDWYLTGDIDDAGILLPEFYFTFELFDSQITVGKKYVKLGPGYFSQLMLSDLGTPLNMLSWEGDFTWSGEEIEYFHMIAYLDEGVNKQLFVHRLSNNTLFENIEIGVSEAVMASRVIHPAYYNPLPFWPYYLTTKLIGLDSEYNNHEDKYLGIDFNYHLDNGARLYGELLVDEYPMRIEDGNPDKRAHLIGYYYPYHEKTELRAEYSNVFNSVYVHRYPENTYTYNGKLLGHWLGNDGDVLDLELSHKLDAKQAYSIGIRGQRKGIGSLDEDFGPDHEEKKFLSEITSTKAEVIVGYKNKVRSNVELEVEGRVGREWTEEGSSNIFGINLSLGIEL